MLPAISNPKTCVPGTPQEGARENPSKQATRTPPAASEVKNAEEAVGSAKKAMAAQIGLNDMEKQPDGSMEVYGNGFRGN